MSHIALGRYNQLEVVKEVDFGVYLNGDEDADFRRAVYGKFEKFSPEN